MRQIVIVLFAFCLASAGSKAQSLRPVDQTPVATTLPLLQVRLDVDPEAPPASRYFVVRPAVPDQSPLLRTLGWKVLFNGSQLMAVNAANSTSLNVTTPKNGKYGVFLTAYLNRRYERISNVIEFDVDLEKGGRPGIPAGAAVARPKSGAASTHASLDAKDLLKLDIKRDGARQVITRPNLPPGTAWTNLSWVVTIDGRHALTAAAHDDPEFVPRFDKKGTYEIHLRAWVNGRELDVSERVKFRIVR